MAEAYVGPRLGTSALGAIFSVIGRCSITHLHRDLLPIKRVDPTAQSSPSADRTTPAGDTKHS